jgi:hypothetical protein
MGEYWKPINVTRKEYVHAHEVNEGLKLVEWTWPGSAVLAIVGTWVPSDDIRICSDYEGDIRVTDAAKSSKEEASYMLCEESPDYTLVTSAVGKDQYPETVVELIRAAAARVPYPDWHAEWREVLKP